jgi:hypothetical protein
MPPKKGHGDLSLECKGGLHTIVGDGIVEKGNSHSNALFVRMVILLAMPSSSALGM